MTGKPPYHGDAILFTRRIGGLGDILMHRMMFEDVKRQSPGMRVVWGVPDRYIEAVADHPFVDEVIDVRRACPAHYAAHYDTSEACGVYESRIAPRSGLHRSDLWAQHCGYRLTRHDMHFRFTGAERAGAASRLGVRPGRCLVCLCPFSAYTGKDLSPDTINGVVSGLLDRGLSTFGLHTAQVDGCDLRFLTDATIRQWMHLIDAADYVITVDTAAAHCAGGLGKPTVAVHSYTDGRVYGRYYPRYEVVQGPCPDGRACYAHWRCPHDRRAERKPCITGVTAAAVLAAFDRLAAGRQAAS